MTYTKHIWLARIGSGLNKFTNSGDATNLILTPNPDSITQAGTPFSAIWMNDIEGGIEQAQVLEFAGTPTGTAATGQLALDTTSNILWYYDGSVWNAFAEVYTATFNASSWSTDSNGYLTQTVTVSGLKASYPVNPFVDVDLSGTDAAADAVLVDAYAEMNLFQTGANSLTCLCTANSPTVNVPVTVVILR